MAVLTPPASGEGPGGARIGGTAPVEFRHGSGPALSNIVVEWDLDGDGDFDAPEENITPWLVEGEAATGRDTPSQLAQAGPGQLRLTLTNPDGRFSLFNQESPLNRPPFAVRSGGRIRVRTEDAPNPDPALLARDLFIGEGPLGADELGNPWQHISPTELMRQQDVHGRTLARTTVKGEVAAAIVSLTTGDFYAQAKVRVRDGTNEAGIVFRRQDPANFGICFLRPGQVVLGEFVDAVWQQLGSISIENRTDVTIGVLLEGDQVTALLEGVPVVTGTTATDPDDANAGIWGGWFQQRPVSFDEFSVWDGLGGEAEGVLWTGRVTSIDPSAPVDGAPTVEISAEGPLLDAAQTDISPPASVGPMPGITVGMTTGELVGATLAAARLLHPPGPIARGTIRPGAVGIEPGKALEIARMFEEIELGFIWETPEGRIGFAGRGDRLADDTTGWWSDAEGAPFSYRTVALGDWRAQIRNRVTARLAPKVPRLAFRSVMGLAAPVGNSVPVNVPLPGPEQAEPGDLLLLVIASAVGTPGREWIVPTGWKSFRDAKDALARMRIYGKVLEPGDLGNVVTLYDGTGVSGGWAAVLWIVKRGTWWGSIDQGVEVTDPTGVGQPTTASHARIGLCPAPVIAPSWGPEVSTMLYHRVGMTSISGVNLPTTVDDDDGPPGYGNVGQFAVTNVPGAEAAVQWAVRDACVEVEAPAPWPAGSDTFGGFEFVECAIIAIRGWAGDPPEASGGLVVQVDDHAAQERLGAILPHDAAAELFADEEDAREYGRAVLARHAGERPVLTLEFPATKNEAYRRQAVRRRIGHRIWLEARRTATLGVSGLFHIEHITHRFASGGTVWDVTWQLSPAA